MRHTGARPLLARFVLALVLWIASVPALGAEADRQTVDLTILHTNDIHGHLLPFSYPKPHETRSPIARMPVTRRIGGLARCASLVRQIESETDGRMLLLDAGDITGETPFSTFYEGREAIEVMRAIGYDAIGLGEWDLKTDPARFEERIEAAGFPVLCANALRPEDGTPLLQPKLMLNRAGIRIGIFGLTSLGSRREKAFLDRVELADPETVARRMVADLREEGADLIIALTHLGISGDVTLATAVSGIDLIVGGHSHTRLEEPKVVSAGDPGTSDYRETIIVQAYRWAGELGRLDLTMMRSDDGSYEPLGFEYRLVPVTEEVPADSTVARVVERLYQPLQAELGETLGTAVADFENVGTERATVHLVADAIRDVTGVHVALQSYGEVRESIFKGPIRKWEIAMMFPQDDRIVLMEISGKRLRHALASPKDFFGFSGMRLVWERRQPKEIEVGGVPLDEEQLYTVAVSGAIYEKMFTDVEDAWDSGWTLHSAVADYIRRNGSVAPTPDGRTRNASD